MLLTKTTGHCRRNMYLAAVISLGFRHQFVLFSIHVHYHFISTLCRCLQSIKTEESDFPGMAFIPLKQFLGILEGWKWSCNVFIPADILLSSPVCLPPPRYGSLSSPSVAGARLGPSDIPRSSAGIQPQLQWPGLVSSPGFPCSGALREAPAGFYWASLQWEIWFCFPQIAIFNFSSN